MLLSLSPWRPRPLSGCTADRTLPPSPTTYAAIQPASALPPPPLSSSAFCCLSSHFPSLRPPALSSTPTPSDRYPATRRAECSALIVPTDRKSVVEGKSVDLGG